MKSTLVPFFMMAMLAPYACDDTSPCEHGATRECTCEGEAGSQLCLWTGEWGDCRCGSSTPDAGAEEDMSGSADMASATDALLSPDMALIDRGPRRVFVTKHTYTAMQVLNACQTAADNAQLGGTWVPWVSKNNPALTSHAIQTINSTGPFNLLNGTTVFLNHAQLAGQPSVPLAMAEDETVFTGTTVVWTGTNTGGMASDYTCLDWTVNQNNQFATVGNATVTTTWTQAPGMQHPCSAATPNHVYCFEQ